MMDKKILNILILWIVCVKLGSGLNKPTFTIRNAQDQVISTPASLLSGAQVKFVCSHEAVTPEQILLSASIEIQLMNGSWALVAKCNTGIATSKAVPSDNALGLNDTHLTCSSTSAIVSTELKLRSPNPITQYRCKISAPLGVDDEQNSDVSVVNAYSQPSDPTITSDPSSMKAGESVKFECQSSAAPQPGLVMYMDGIEQERFTPDVQSAAVQNVVQSSLSWIVTVDSSMHNKSLKCQVDDHPFPSDKIKEMQLNIIYGPADIEPEKTFDYKSDAEILPLECDMSSYPEVEGFNWYKGIDSTSIGTEKTLSVDLQDFENLQVDESKTVKYRCTATNPANDNKTGEKSFEVKVTKVKGSTTAKPNSDESKSEPLASWVIPVAVVVPVVVIILVIIIPCCVKRRNQSSPSAKKSKAAQARRPSDDRNDAAKYQSSTASLARQDANAGRGANYHENPTLPMEYRYSHGNVEQYAEAIDDMPRSRRPIALDDMAMFDEQGGPPVYGEAPPAYAHETQYRMDHNYSTYSPSYGSSYGAAC